MKLPSVSRKTKESWIPITTFGEDNVNLFLGLVYSKSSGRKQIPFWYIVRSSYIGVYIFFLDQVQIF